MPDINADLLTLARSYEQALLEYKKEFMDALVRYTRDGNARGFFDHDNHAWSELERKRQRASEVYNATLA